MAFTIPKDVLDCIGFRIQNGIPEERQFWHPDRLVGMARRESRKEMRSWLRRTWGIEFVPDHLCREELRRLVLDTVKEFANFQDF